MKVMSYKLNMDPKLYAELEKIADKRCVTVAELLRRGIKWVFLEHELERVGGSISVKTHKKAKSEKVLRFM